MSVARLVLLAAFVALALGACRRDAGPTAHAVPDEQRQRVASFWQRLGAAGDARVAGDCARARDLYLEALRLEPRHEDALYYLGQCQRMLAEPAEARRTFETLVEVNPASARGHLALGALLASSNPREPLDLRAAEAHLRRAHEINGEETGPMLRLGEVLLVLDRADEARRWLEAAARTNPKSVEAPFLLGYLLWESGDSRGAVSHLTHAVRAVQGDAPPKGVLGEGDRKAPAAATDGSVRAAPPLREPMGRTLFSELTQPLRDPDAGPGAARPDDLYRAVAAARRAIRARSVQRSPASDAHDGRHGAAPAGAR